MSEPLIIRDSDGRLLSLADTVCVKCESTRIELEHLKKELACTLGRAKNAGSIMVANGNEAARLREQGRSLAVSYVDAEEELEHLRAVLPDHCYRCERPCRYAGTEEKTGAARCAECLLSDALAEIERLKKLQLHLVDVVWGVAHEDESVPSTVWARRMIVQARETFDPTAPLPPPCVACSGSGRNRPPGLKMPGWGEPCSLCKGPGIAEENRD